MNEKLLALREEIIARGDVQQVGFRDAVQNLEPYDVKIVAEGEEAALLEFVKAIIIQDGPIRDSQPGAKRRSGTCGRSRGWCGEETGKEKKADLAVIEQDALVQGPPPRRELNREDIQNT